MDERPNPDSTPPAPLRTGFQGDLTALDDRFVSMALAVAEALPRLTADFLAGDRSSIDDAKELAAETADEREEIEHAGFILLAREAPVSGDLRRLVAILRLVADVDRTASLLKHVSESLERLDPRLLPDSVRTHVVDLAHRSVGVFRDGIEAWRRKDALAVHEVDDADEAVDHLQETLLEETTRHDLRDEALVLGLIARYYERIADHGVAIAQDAAFVATGERVPVGKARLRERGMRD